MPLHDRKGLSQTCCVLLVQDTLFDEFVIAHVLGWYAKAITLRSMGLIWTLSIGFELMEVRDNRKHCILDDVLGAVLPASTLSFSSYPNDMLLLQDTLPEERNRVTPVSSYTHTLPVFRAGDIQPHVAQLQRVLVGCAHSGHPGLQLAG